MLYRRLVFALGLVGLVGFAVAPGVHQPLVALGSAVQAGGGQGRGGAGGGGGPMPTIEDRTSGMRKIDGFFPLYWDERAGTMLLEIPRFDTRRSCTSPGCRPVSARTTSASIAVGGGGARSCASSASGRRSCSSSRTSRSARAARNPLERKSVEDSFAQVDPLGLHRRRPNRAAACWSTRRRSSCATDPTRPARCGPGTYRLDPTRSAFYLPNTRNFPKNTEVDMTLTFVNDGGGGRGGGNAAGPSQGPQPIGAGNGGGRGGRRRPRRRAVLRHGGERDAVGRRGHDARARVVRRAARRQLQAARRRSARAATAA